MEICVAGPILTHKNTKGSMEKRYPYSTRLEENILAILHFWELEPFSYYFVFTKTLNLSNVKYIFAYIHQYSPIKIYQNIYGTTIYILYKMGEKLWQFFIFMELEPFFYYFVITKTPNLSNVK